MNTIVKAAFGVGITALLLAWNPIAPNQKTSKSIERGKKIYTSNCAVCHMANGQGISKVFPPLAQSDYLMEDINRAGDVIRNGLKGKIIVNETSYTGMMAAFSLSDQELADVVNYITNSWGNEAEEVDAAWASKIKKK